MKTSLAHLALYVAKDCDAYQALGVRLWSVIAIVALSAQFGWLALAAVVGSFIGLAIRDMASRGARDVRKNVNEISARSFSDRAESHANSTDLIASAGRTIRCLAQRAFGVAVATFAALGIAHVALSTRLFPKPICSRV